MSIRINPDLLPALLSSIQQSQQSESVATQQMSSGRSTNQPSDNPAATAAIVFNHSQAAQDAQYLQNINSLQGRFQVADSTLSGVVTALTQAVGLGTEGANGTLNDANRQAVASQVEGILTQVTGFANTSYQGTFLFSGTSVNIQPFETDGSTGQLIYKGNSNTTSVELSNGNSITSNVPGDQLFLNPKGSVLGSLQDLYTALSNGTNIGQAVNEVSDALNQLDIQRVTYGNALNQINLAETALNQDKVNVSEQETSLVGADLATVATNFAQAQLASQAAISATSRILSQKTLLDYLV